MSHYREKGLLGTYFLHSLHGQFFGFHPLMSLLKGFNSKGTTSQILGSKYKILLLPWEDLTCDITDFELIPKLWFTPCRWKISLKMGGDTFRYILNIFVANICQFLVCVVTDLSMLYIYLCSNNFLKDENLSLYNRPKHLSCRRLILLFIIGLWNIQIRGY